MAGQSASGRPPLVLLHALPMDGSMWVAQVSALGAEGTVTPVDLPGFGKAPASAEPPSLDDWARTVANQVRARGITRAAVAGCSMGGYVALALLRAAPSLLAGIALVDSRASADNDEQRAARFANIDLIRHSGVAAYVGPLIDKGISPLTARRPEILGAIRAVASVARGESIVAALRAMAARPDSRQALASAHMPVAIIHGADDQIIPIAEARELARSMPAALSIDIPAAGHFSPMERPEAVSDALRRFWQMTG